MNLTSSDHVLFQEKFGPLESGEELVWLGKPGHVRDWDIEQIAVILINLIGLSLIACWELEHFKHPPWSDPQAGFINWMAPLTPLPIALFCCYMIAPRIYLRRRLRGRTTYAVTSRRILSDERSLRARHQVLRLSDHLKFRSRRDNQDLMDYVFWSRKKRLFRKFVLFEAVLLPPSVLELVSK